MNIVFVIPALKSGGAERVVSLLANYFSSSNKVSIVCFNEDDPHYKLNPRVKLYNLDASIRRRGLLRLITIPFVELKRFLGIRKIVKLEEADVVISFLFTSNFFVSILKLTMKVRTIVSERNDPTFYHPLKRFLNKILYRLNDEIVFQTKKVKEMYKYNRGVVISNPIDLKQISVFRNTNVKKFKIVSVGRLVEQKNYMFGIEVIRSLVNECNYNILYEIYGSGHLDNKIIEQINRYGLESNIKLMGSVKDLWNRISDANVFLMTSYFEGFPNALLESISLGIPSVVSEFPTGASSEMIHNGLNGFVISDFNVDEYVDKVKLILDNDVLYNDMVRYNYEVSKKYDTEKIFNLWEKILLK